MLFPMVTTPLLDSKRNPQDLVEFRVHVENIEKLGALLLVGGDGGAKHSPTPADTKFHKNHEILKVPRNYPSTSRIIRDHS